MTADRGRRIAVAVVVVVVAVLLGWVALREAVFRAFPMTAPIVRAVGAGDPRYRGAPQPVRSLESLIQPIDATSRRRIAATLQQLPLAEEPFVAEGQGAFQDGDLNRSIRLLEEARHRAPRNRAARLLLLDRYARAERLEEAVAEVATLRRLIPDASDALVALVAQLAALPKALDPIRSVLLTDPVLANGVLGHLAYTGADPATVLALSQGVRTRVAPGQPDWRGALVEALVKRGDYAAARGLWQRYNRFPATADLVHDAVLRGNSGGPPFGWSGIDEGVGAIDWRRGGGVDVSYYGRQSGVLLSQLLTLSPGSYQLRYLNDSAVDASGSGLVWRVRCVDAKQSIVEVPVARAAGGATFTVAPGCRAQRLSLDGVADEFPQEINTTVRRVSVTRAGSVR